MSVTTQADKNLEEAKEHIQKGLYTEEEVKKLFDSYRIFRNENPNLSIHDSETWFEQNKKK